MIFAVELKGKDTFFWTKWGGSHGIKMCLLRIKDQLSIEQEFKILDEAMYVCLKDNYETREVLEN